MNHFQLLAFVLFFTVLLGLAPSHAETQCQRELNRIAATEFTEADAELNKVYRQLLAQMDDREQKLFRDVQLSWLRYRDTQTTWYADSERGGSIYPCIVDSRMTELTEQRTQELRAMLKGQ